MNHDRLRKPRQSFTQVPNDLICSPTLSAKAKVVYCYLISRPDNWKFYTKEIALHMKESEKTILVGMNELIAHGWIERTRIREKGKFTHTEYALFHEPLTITPKTTCGKTTRGKTTTEKTNTYLEKFSKEEKKEKQQIKNVMKFRQAFIKEYMFTGFIAYDLSEADYNHLEFTVNADMMIAVKDTKERITKELALEVWKFLYNDYHKEDQLNKEAFLLMDYKKDLQIGLN